MYEFEPAPGVKVNRITNLSDDLALALRALSIRIIAPIPGKSVVGIEVPNPEREIVYIRDLLECEKLPRQRIALTLALGKDIFGNPRRSRSREHAAPARRGRDRHGQERVPELAALLDPLPRARPTR